MVARESRPDPSSRQSPESESPPETIARWERNRALGRSTFIWRRGVFGWGIPVALVTIAYQVVQEQGFVWRLVLTQHLKTGIAIAMLVFPLCGYLFGRYLWTAGEENYERVLGNRKASAGKRASPSDHRDSGTDNESSTRPTRHRDEGR
jgi:hypothetical protein